MSFQTSTWRRLVIIMSNGVAPNLWVVVLVLLAGSMGWAQNTPRVYNTSVEANWLEGGTRFWHRMEQPGGGGVFFIVDAESGTRVRAFDHEAAGRAMGVEGSALPITDLVFDDDGAGVTLVGSMGRWRVDVSKGSIEKVEVGDGAGDGLVAWAERPKVARRWGRDTHLFLIIG